MNPHSRACIAFIAARLHGIKGSSIYDYVQCKNINFSGSVDSTKINLLDHDRGCSICGTPEKLFDYGINAYIQLSMDGAHFKGFDHHTGDHFGGYVKGNVVALYDPNTFRHYNYIL